MRARGHNRALWIVTAQGLLAICLLSILATRISAQPTLTTALARVEKVLSARNIDSMRTLFAQGGRVFLGIKGVSPGYYSLEQSLAILDGLLRKSKPLSFKVKTTNIIAENATAIGELRVQQERAIATLTAVLGFIECKPTWCINRILLY